MKTNMRTRTLPLCTAMTLWVALALPVRLSAQTITTFDAPGAGTGFFQGTFVNSMNPAGTIAGYYTDASYGTHGFLRAKDGTITTFDATPASIYTNAASINSAGTITGYWADPAIFPDTDVFVRDPKGIITTFAPPGSI